MEQTWVDPTTGIEWINYIITSPWMTFDQAMAYPASIGEPDWIVPDSFTLLSVVDHACIPCFREDTPWCADESRKEAYDNLLLWTSSDYEQNNSVAWTFATHDGQFYPSTKTNQRCILMCKLPSP